MGNNGTLLHSFYVDRRNNLFCGSHVNYLVCMHEKRVPHSTLQSFRILFPIILFHGREAMVPQHMHKNTQCIY